MKGSVRGEEREQGKGQQPVLDDHSTHYSTDAAADPVGKEDPFSFTRRHPPGPALLRVLAPHLPAISRGGCPTWKLTKLMSRISEKSRETISLAVLPVNIDRGKLTFNCLSILPISFQRSMLVLVSSFVISLVV